MSDVESQLALKFYEASLTKKSADVLRAITSINFHCHSTWDYGKDVKYDNVEQMIGGFKLVPWSATCKDYQVRVTGEGVLEAKHQEKPTMLGPTNFFTVANTWTFTYVEENGEKKIDSVKIVTVVTR